MTHGHATGLRPTGLADYAQAVAWGVAAGLLGVLLARETQGLEILRELSARLAAPVFITAPVGLVFGALGAIYFATALRQGPLWGVVFTLLAPVAYTLASILAFKTVDFESAPDWNAFKLGASANAIGGSSLLLLSLAVNARRARAGRLVALAVLFALGGGAASALVGDLATGGGGGGRGGGGGSAGEFFAISLPHCVWAAAFFVLYTASHRKPRG